MNRTTLVILAMTGVVTAGFIAWSKMSGRSQHTLSVSVPALTGVAKAGEALFNANCAVCHGTNAAGSDKGPPLVHKIYEPGHHGDASFLSAARVGVRAHHWNFGNMPAQPHVKEHEVARIVDYVRTLQRANGIN